MILIAIWSFGLRVVFCNNEIENKNKNKHKHKNKIER